MRTRSLTRSLAVSLVTLGLAAAGTASAVACDHGHHGAHKKIHSEKATVNVSDDDTNLLNTVIFSFGPMQNR